MKFSDPLASLYYLAGMLPTHLALAAYGGFCWFFRKSQIECPDVSDDDIFKEYNSVFYMLLAHVT